MQGDPQEWTPATMGYRLRDVDFADGVFTRAAPGWTCANERAAAGALAIRARRTASRRDV